VSFEARLARGDDEVGVRKLFARIFGREMTPEEWRWKYAENPDGGLSVVAESDGAIVGHFGGCPMAASIAGRVRPIYALGDVMTDPAFRQAGGRSNVFSSMGREMFRRLAERDAPFGFGFPNARALEVGRRLLGYREHFPVREISFPALPAPAQSRLETVGTVGEEFAAIWNRCRADFAGAGLVRDGDRVNWRFASRPDRRYRMILADARGGERAWAALAARGETLLVLDYLVPPPAGESVAEFVRLLREEAGRVGARRLVFWESPAGPYRAPLAAEASRAGAETIAAGFSFVTAVVFREDELERFLRDVHFTPSFYDDR
jgi:hypothetical protein